MTLLRRSRIGIRLGLGFGIVLLLTALVGGFGILQTARVNEDAVQLGTNWLPSVQVLGEIRGTINDARRAALRHVLEPDAEGKQRQAATRDDLLLNTLAPLFMKYDQLVSSPEERRLFDALKARLAESHELDRRLIDLSNGGEADFAAARQLAVGASAQAFAAVVTAIQRSVAVNADGAANEIALAAATYRQAMRWAIGGIVAAVLAGLAMARAITASIAAPMRESVELAETVARGDLTSRVTVTGRDEAADLLGALARMSAQLATMVDRVRPSSDSIATGSQQIAIGNADLSQRTEAQASNLEQTAASMKQLTSTVKCNADTARQADDWPAPPPTRPSAAGGWWATWSRPCKRSPAHRRRSPTSSA